MCDRLQKKPYCRIPVQSDVKKAMPAIFKTFCREAPDHVAKAKPVHDAPPQQVPKAYWR